MTDTEWFYDNIETDRIGFFEANGGDVVKNLSVIFLDVSEILVIG